nr:S8/S53 family peptidase [Cellulomonas sp. APG4]
MWYYRDTGVAEAHATTTGEGITVAVIDSPINPDVPDLSDADLTIHEPSFCDDDGDGIPEPATSTITDAQHGTSMVALIAGDGDGVDGQPGVQGLAPAARVLHYAWESGDIGTCAGLTPSGTAAAIDQAVADGAHILNLAYGFNGATAEDLAALREAIRAGVIVVTPAGKGTGPVSEWPALVNGAVTVTGVTRSQELVAGFALHGPGLDVAAPAEDVRVLSGEDWRTYKTVSGTSLATAWTSGALALAWSAHPEATGNQMIQSLLRNTVSGEGELNRLDDYWGYGIVSVRRMLETDPTTYPDVNPLIVDAPDAQPPASALLPAPEPTTEPTPTADPTPDPGPPTTAEPVDGPPLLPVALGLGVLTLTGTVAAVLLRRRAHRDTAPGHDR